MSQKQASHQPPTVDQLERDAPMTAQQAAAYLGVTVRTFDRIGRTDPSMPCHRLGTGTKAPRRFYRSELDGWLRSRWSRQQPGRAS
jgi:excisionase family DNA binding protein